MNVIITLIWLLCFTVKYGTGLNVYCEGREAVLRFSFPRRDIDVTLQIGNRHPFYSNYGGIGQMLESGLYKHQINRFQVKQTDTDNHYNIILIISNVSREDDETYISFVYIDGEIITDLTKRIALAIEYSPGNPHCRYVSPSYIDVIRNTWDVVECSADIGTMPGYIVCFQNNEILPIHGTLVKNSTTLSQRIWVKRDRFFSCCSSDYRNLVDASSCKAFTSPASGKENSVTHPQLPFVSSTTQNYIFSAENVSTTSTLFDDVQCTPSTQTSTIERLLLAIVLLILVMIIFLCRKVWNMGHKITSTNEKIAETMDNIYQKYTENDDICYRNRTTYGPYNCQHNATPRNSKHISLYSQSSGVGSIHYGESGNISVTGEQTFSSL